MKEDLMFYSAYEDFYSMAARSAAFGEYCREDSVRTFHRTVSAIYLR